MSAVTSAFPTPRKETRVEITRPYSDPRYREIREDGSDLEFGATREVSISFYVHGLGEFRIQKTVWTLEKSTMDLPRWSCPDLSFKIYLQQAYKHSPYSVSGVHKSWGGLLTFEEAVQKAHDMHKTNIDEAIALVEKFAPRMLKLK